MKTQYAFLCVVAWLNPTRSPSGVRFLLRPSHREGGALEGPDLGAVQDDFGKFSSRSGSSRSPVIVDSFAGVGHSSSADVAVEAGEKERPTAETAATGRNTDAEPVRGSSGDVIRLSDAEPVRRSPDFFAIAGQLSPGRPVRELASAAS